MPYLFISSETDELYYTLLYIYILGGTVSSKTKMILARYF